MVILFYSSQLDKFSHLFCIASKESWHKDSASKPHWGHHPAPSLNHNSWEIMGYPKI